MEQPFFTQDEIARLSELRDREKAADPRKAFEKAESVFLFGAGRHGSALLVELCGLGARVEGFLDNDPARWNEEFCSLPIRRPDDPGVLSRNPLIVLAAYDPGVCFSLFNQCALLGLRPIHWWDARLGQPPREDAAALAANPDALAATAVWDDPESRAVYIARVRYAATRDLRDMPTVTPAQYFIPEIPCGFYRNFVDGGAFDGDTFAAFRRLFGDDFDSYHAFEADSRTFPKLQAALPGDPRIHLYPLALHSEKVSLPFLHIGHEASGVAAGGGQAVSAVSANSLDNILGDERVTFVKLDIEGAEPEALLGAEKIVASQMPALAVCVYHATDHLWRIPLWIKARAPEYRLVLRNHVYSDTVCYAIPPEGGP